MRPSCRTRRGGEADVSRSGGLALLLAISRALHRRHRLPRHRDPGVGDDSLDREARDRRAPDRSSRSPGGVLRRPHRPVRPPQRRGPPRLALRHHRRIPADRSGHPGRSVRGPADVSAEVLCVPLDRRSHGPRHQRHHGDAVPLRLRHDQRRLHGLRLRRRARGDAGGGSVADAVGAGALSRSPSARPTLQPDGQRADAGGAGPAQRPVGARPGIPERHRRRARVHARAARARRLRTGQPRVPAPESRPGADGGRVLAPHGVDLGREVGPSWTIG
jgi:hypothetical protein